MFNKKAVLLSTLWLSLFSATAGANNNPALSPDDIDNLVGVHHNNALFPNDPLSIVMNPWARFQDKVKQQSDLEFGFAYTTLSQYTTKGVGPRTGAVGGLDLFARWNAVKNPAHLGVLAIAFETRDRIASSTSPAQLSGTIGTNWPVVDGFDNHKFVLTELWWEQSLCNDQLSYRVGKFENLDFFDNQPHQSSNEYFVNSAFSKSPGLYSAAHGLGLVVKAKKNNFYAMAGINDVNAVKTEFDPGQFFDNGRYYTAVELGYGVKGEQDLYKNLHVTLWHADQGNRRMDRIANKGVTVSATYPFTRVTPFARAAFASPSNAAPALESLWSVGLLVPQFLNQPYQTLGMAFARGGINQPTSKQSVLELFYKIQLTPHIAITPDIQWVFDAPNALKQTQVYALRFRIT